MSVSLDPRQSVHIARQPVLDAKRHVHGYELLYRAHGADAAGTASNDLAAARVVTDAVLAIGLDALTSGAPAFLHLTRQLLLENAAALLPPKTVVIELREDAVVDAELVDACRELKAKGYALALGDFVADSGAEALLPFATYVKFDVRDTAPILWQPVAHRLASRSVQVIAGGIESADTFAQARDAGCTLFQGYYFCRPATQSAKALPARRLAYMNLFAAVNKPDLSIADLESLVKRDVSLTMRVLKSINSAAYGIGHQITSVHHALVLLGVQQVRQWASVWAMAGLNSGGTPEVASIALLRARSCEIVGNAWLGSDAGSELFLLGMCSMLDAIVDQPMEQAIADLHLTPSVREALLGGTNAMRSILDAVIAHEQGDWDTSAEIVEVLGLPSSIVSTAYADALRWTRDISA